MLALLHFEPPEDNSSQSAVNLVERAHFLPKLAQELAIETTVFHAQELLSGTAPALVSALLSRCQRAWRFGRSMPQAQLVALEELLNRDYALSCFDSAEAIEQCNNLTKSYARLKDLGLSQADTQFVSLSEDELQLSEAALTKRLRARLPTKLPEQGVFLRSFYSSRKGMPYLNFASTAQDLLKRCVDNALFFREHESDVGGFAIRELCEIESIWESSQRYCIAREFRVFVLDGEPIFWVCHSPLEELRYKVSASDLEKLAPPVEEPIEELAEEPLGEVLRQARLAAGALDARFLTVDFAYLKTGRWLLVETNPGYCAGWNHRAALVGVYAQVLQRLADRDWLDREQLLTLCQRLGIELWGRTAVFDFVSPRAVSRGAEEG